jgi:hypothetical protein
MNDARIYRDGLPIAILCSTYHFAIDWMKYSQSVIKIKTINEAHRRIIDENNQEYLLVQKIEDIRGYNFLGYIKSPDYETLEDHVKARIVNV